MEERSVMERRIVDGEITLVPYDPNYKASLPWYQDADVCKQVDNRNSVYDLKLLKTMYRYLNARGSLFTSSTAAACAATSVCIRTARSTSSWRRASRTSTSAGASSAKFKSSRGNSTSPNCTRRSTRSMRSRSGCSSAPDSTRPTTSCTKWNYNFQIEKAPAR